MSDAGSARSLSDPFAPHSQGQFVEPWLRRVREVDDDTARSLLRQLQLLRRFRNLATAFAAVGGSLVFGVINHEYGLLIHATLAAFAALPVFAGGSLAIRRLFLQEARRLGVSKSAALLVLTRAERRERLLAPWLGTDDRIERLLQAVRDPDRPD